MYSYNAQLVEIHDGDTLVFYVDLGFYIWTLVPVRLTGIDIASPDKLDNKRETQALKFLHDKFEGVEFCVIETHRDEEGDITADIIINGKTINQEMERRGLLRGSSKLQPVH